MVGAAYFPKRGDIVWITLDPQEGHEQAGRRPALVISHTEYNRVRGMAVMCAITKQAKGRPFETLIPAGPRVTGVVLADQIKCVAYRERAAEFIAAAPRDLIEEVLAKLSTLFFDD